MDIGIVTSPDHLDDAAGGQHVDNLINRHVDGAHIAFGRPQHQTTTKNEIACAVPPHHHAGRQVADDRAKRRLRAISGQALFVQDAIDLTGFSTPALRECLAPKLGKPRGIVAPAFVAGPMACCEGCRFVQKEQLRIAVGPHDLPPAPFELEAARDPAFVDPALQSKGLVRPVQHPAPVAHQGSPCRRLNNFTFWRDAVLQRHMVAICPDDSGD